MIKQKKTEWQQQIETAIEDCRDNQRFMRNMVDEMQDKLDAKDKELLMIKEALYLALRTLNKKN